LATQEHLCFGTERHSLIYPNGIRYKAMQMLIGILISALLQYGKKGFKYQTKWHIEN